MKEIILATNNEHKKKELSLIFGREINLKTLRKAGFDKKIIENGRSFIENSLIKCKTVYDIIKKPIMADDSGLCVEQLKGAPGILSARYGKKNFTDRQRYEHLLGRLKDTDTLNASFVCALVLYINANRIYIVQEEISGLITFNPKGDNGFGYDPVFFLPHYNKTMAELTDKQKNRISHRGRASMGMKKIIENITF